MKTRMILATLATIAMPALAGCANWPSTTNTSASSTQNIAETCASISAAVKILSLPAATAKLSTNEIYAINTALTVSTPICTAPAPPTLASAKLSALLAAAGALNTYAAAYKSTGTPP